MKSHNISIQDNKKCSTPSVEQRGFTLIEVLIVVGIIAFIAVIGMITSLDTLNRYIFRSDTDKVVSLLQKARSSAMNNVNEKSYGVYLGDGSDFILFRGTNYIEDEAFNYKVERNKTATLTSTCTDDQVVFSQLTGQTAGCEIKITEGSKVATTTIYSQGGINY